MDKHYEALTLQDEVLQYRVPFKALCTCPAGRLLADFIWNTVQRRPRLFTHEVNLFAIPKLVILLLSEQWHILAIAIKFARFQAHCSVFGSVT